MNVSPISTLPLPTPRPGGYDIHVVPHQGHWAVKSEHVQAYQGYFLTQVEATAFGMSLARSSAASLVVHGTDGRFREVYNYGR